MKTDIVIPSKETYATFKVFFDRDLAGFKDIILMAVTRRFSFDIFGFNEYCKTYLGYKEDDNTSLSDFVKKKYGEKANELIKCLLNF